MKNAVFVTGGTVGSGYAIAERFAKEGFGVVITSRSGERAAAAAEEIDRMPQTSEMMAAALAGCFSAGGGV